MGRFDSSHSRWNVASLLGAGAVGVAAFSATWLLLAPAAVETQGPAAVVRRQASDSDQLDRRLVEVLRTQSLRRLVDEAAIGGRSQGQRDLVEWARANLRVEISDPDRAGKQTVAIAWVGEPDVKGAARLVNLLARELADQPSPPDLRSLERQLDQAHADAVSAERALARARQEFGDALAAASAQPQFDAVPPPAAEPKPTPATESSGHAAWFTARQQLAELERRRDVLAERLMPEHPEMKALDEMIDVLRSSLNNQPTPAPMVAEASGAVAESTAAVSRFAPAALDRIHELGRKVASAQEQYSAALSAERACWQRLAQASGGPLAEIEPAAESPQLAGHASPWQRWLASLFAAIGFGGLAFVAWPCGKTTFTSVEEVRASTRLPVVVVDHVMLN